MSVRGINDYFCYINPILPIPPVQKSPSLHKMGKNEKKV